MIQNEIASALEVDISMLIIGKSDNPKCCDDGKGFGAYHSLDNEGQ